ncbi:SPOSA6832_01047, partial [Sporobolomyces salmonicolor]
MSAATATASTGGVYVPPFAATTAGTAAGGSTGTSISFAHLASATGTGTATSSASIVDSTGGVDSSSLLQYFTIPYIDAHSLSIPTYRYAYMLWFILVGTLIIWSAAYHLSGTGTGGSPLGAWFRKWSIRRITWTKRVGGGRTKEVGKSQEEGGRGATTQTARKKVVWASPTFAQMITIGVLIVAALCLSFVGDDYIAPTTCTFGGYCGYQSYFGSSSPPKSTYRVRRDFLPFRLSPFSVDSDKPSFAVNSNKPSFAVDHDMTAPPPTPAELGFQLARPVNAHRLVKKGINNPNGWAPFNDPLLASSNKNIAANAWTAAARLGLISFAMLPLAVTLALKQWPFNIWATPWLTNYHFDKVHRRCSLRPLRQLTSPLFLQTAILHRWSGRVIWAFSTGHAIAWFYELSIDKDPFGRPVLIPVWSWYRFTAGAVAWVLLTIITVFSFKPIRNRFYELFYWSHLLIFDQQPLMWWPIAAVAWWGVERFVRFVVFLWINGIMRGIWFKEPSKSSHRSSSQSFGMTGAEKLDGYDEVKVSGGAAYPPVPYAESIEPLASHPMQSRQSSVSIQYPPPSPSFSPTAPSYHSNAFHAPAQATRSRVLPPLGFAAAQLLPGRTIRLTLHIPHSLRWAPGQHLLLYVPSVRFFESHPYTIASIDSRAKGVAPLGSGSTGLAKSSEVVLLVRAQKGFSRALWDYVVKARRQKELRGAVAAEVAKGVNLRALVGWPMGSAGRVSWGAYESLTIVAGGTGITFGISVLEYACTRIMRKMEDPKWKTSRVRFVWILREFGAFVQTDLTRNRTLICLSYAAHLSWVATTLRRCMEMCDSSRLQIDLFVTHDAPRRSRRRPQPQPYTYGADSTEELAPPTAPFARGSRSDSFGRDSVLSEASDWSDTEDASSSSPSRQRNEMPDYGSDVDSVTELVLFDGEDDSRTPGEAEVSAKLKKEGKLRRALSRRGQGKAAASSRPLAASASVLSDSRQHSVYYQPHESFEALPLDHRDVPPASLSHPHNTYPPSAASFGDLGHVPYRSFDYDERSDVQTLGGASSTRHLFGGRSNPNSHSDLIGAAAAPDSDDAFFLDVTEAEQDDLDAVAELARPGYPRLKEIIDDEVNRSAGKTMVACKSLPFRSPAFLPLFSVVSNPEAYGELSPAHGPSLNGERSATRASSITPIAKHESDGSHSGENFRECCGPSSLNTLVRNLVASRIDLKKVAQGDPRGQISLVVEVRETPSHPSFTHRPDGDTLYDTGLLLVPTKEPAGFAIARPTPPPARPSHDLILDLSHLS